MERDRSAFDSYDHQAGDARGGTLIVLSPDLPQLRDRAYVANLAAFFRRLDAAGFARVLGAAQASATERGIRGAIVALGDAQAAVENWTPPVEPGCPGMASYALGRDAEGGR